MSTYYDFMVEAKYKDKWYNIDLHTKDFDGKLRHHRIFSYPVSLQSVKIAFDWSNSMLPVILRISRNS